MELLFSQVRDMKKRTVWIIIITVLILLLGYVIVLLSTPRVHAPGNEFRGPTSPPSTKGPGNRLPGQ